MMDMNNKIIHRVKGVFSAVTWKDGYIHVPVILWVLVILSYCIIFPLHTYNDILITAKQGYSFWNLLLEGRPLDFYLETASMVSGNPFYPVVQGAAYLFPVYLVFAVWNFPTWALEKASGMALFNSIPSMIWMKLMLVPFLVISTIQIFKIVDKSRNKEYAQLAAFLFLSSILVIYPTAIIGQYDVLGLPFILWGISSWMDKKTKSFVFSFSIALTFKYFALFYFLPLLVMREKKILSIFAKFILVMIPSVFFTFLFPRPYGSSGNLELIELLMQGPTISGVNAVVSWFPMAFALVLLIAYFRPQEENEDALGTAANYLFLTMASFCILVNPFPYWVILAAPAFVLLFATRTHNINKVLLLESALSWGIAVKNYIIYYWCFSVTTTGAMGVLHRILGEPSPDPSEGYSVFLRFLDSPLGLSLVFTGLLVLFIVTIYFSRPKCEEIELWEPLNNGTLYLRTIGNMALAFLPAAYIAYIMITY